MTVTPAAAPLFRPVLVLWMVVVGVVAFGGFLVLSAYAPELRGGEGGGAHAVSNSAVGYSGLVRLLQEAGTEAELDRGRGRNRERSLLVVTPELTNDEDVLQDLDFSGPTLIVLPKWETEPEPTRRGWVRKARPADAAAVRRVLRAVARDADVARSAKPSKVVLRDLRSGATRTAGSIDQLQTISGEVISPMVVDAGGRAVLARVSSSNIYVLAEPDLLSNHGLKSLENARTAVTMVEELRRGAGPVSFDVTLNGLGGGRNLLKLAFEPPFLAATLCALAAALLAAIQAAIRFGPERRPERALALGKRALADNAAALIRIARREHRMGERYAQLVRNQAARSVAAPRELSGERLDAFLDRLAERAGSDGRIGELARAAASARDAESLVASARNLHRWKLEITRARQS